MERIRDLNGIITRDIICDMHVHTKFSCDSEAALEAYCLAAVQKKVSVLCFTDHVDYNANDYGYGYYNVKEFWDEFLRVKEKYNSVLTLLCGIEFSEPHLYQSKLRDYLSFPYDYILGSIHYWYKDMFPSSMVRSEVPVEICYEHYWNEVLSAVKAGGFDVLGHMDFPKRYYKQLIVDTEKIYEICNAVVRNNIYLEINTSALRMGLSETLPGKEILSIYKSCGGKYVTVGSDAHNADELAADYSFAKKMIDYFNFTQITFIKRQLLSVESVTRASL